MPVPTTLPNPVDPRDAPLYTFTVAARHLGIPTGRLRRWVIGRSHSRRRPSAPARPLIRAPAGSGLISFNNLVEAHFLRAFAVREVDRMALVGRALAKAEEALGLERLLLRDELGGPGRKIVLDRLGEWLALSRSTRLAMRHALATCLDRVDRDDDGLATRFHPFVPWEPASKSVVIDPRVFLGQPTVADSGVATAAVVSRVDAGEEFRSIADDLGLEVSRIMDAVLYERSAW